MKHHATKNWGIVSIACIVFCIFLAPALNLYATSDVEVSGDILRILMPVSVLSYTFAGDDAPGRCQFVKSFVFSTAVTYALKTIIDKDRPNGESKSFPSGHTAMAFSSAAFVHKRYGLKSGLPMYGLATYVGWTRVQSDNHDISDVATGAAIGILGSFYFTTPKGTEVVFQPTLTEEKIGFTCSILL